MVGAFFGPRHFFYGRYFSRSNSLVSTLTAQPAIFQFHKMGVPWQWRCYSGDVGWQCAKLHFFQSINLIGVEQHFSQEVRVFLHNLVAKVSFRAITGQVIDFISQLQAARQVKIRWQNLIERRIDLKTGEKPEVISDLQTRTTREKALTLLSQRYSHIISKETLENLEKTIYNHFRPVIGDKYRRSVRKIALHRSKFQQHLENKDFDLVVKQVTTGEK